MYPIFWQKQESHESTKSLLNRENVKRVTDKKNYA